MVKAQQKFQVIAEFMASLYGFLLFFGEEEAYAFLFFPRPTKRLRLLERVEIS